MMYYTHTCPICGQRWGRRLCDLSEHIGPCPRCGRDPQFSSKSIIEAGIAVGHWGYEDPLLDLVREVQNGRVPSTD